MASFRLNQFQSPSLHRLQTTSAAAIIIVAVVVCSLWPHHARADDNNIFLYNSIDRCKSNEYFDVNYFVCKPCDSNLFLMRAINGEYISVTQSAVAAESVECTFVWPALLLLFGWVSDTNTHLRRNAPRFGWANVCMCSEGVRCTSPIKYKLSIHNMDLCYSRLCRDRHSNYVVNRWTCWFVLISRAVL